jgi:iron complex transport system substrate-binding protein
MCCAAGVSLRPARSLEPIMKSNFGAQRILLSRRMFLIGAGAASATLLAACAAPAVSPTAVPTVAPPNTPAPEPTAAPAPTASAAPSASAIDAIFNRQAVGYPAYDNIDLIDVLGDKGDMLSVAHKYGQVDIAKAPKRLVVDHGLVEVCLALGVKPAAAIVYGDLPPSVADKVQGIEIIPGGDAVSIEALAALKPDLLIGHFYFGGFDEAIYKQVSVVAPTVILRELPHWSLVTRDMAKLLGRQAEAEALFADYAKRLDAARAKMAPVVGEGTVALVQVLPERLYLSGPGAESNGKFLPAYFGTFLYRDLGLKPAPVVSKLVGKQEIIDLSLEMLPQIDADVLLVVPTSRPGSVIQEQEIYKSFLVSPLYKAIPAVKAGKAFELGPIPESYYATVDFVDKLADLMARSK